MLYHTTRLRARPLAARLLLTALLGAALAACGENHDAPPLAQEPVPVPPAADPARACSAKSPNMRCAP